MGDCKHNTGNPSKTLGEYWMLVQRAGGTYSIKDYDYGCPGHTHVVLTIGDQTAIGSDLAQAAAKILG